MIYNFPMLRKMKNCQSSMNSSILVSAKLLAKFGQCLALFGLENPLVGVADTLQSLWYFIGAVT